MPRLSDIIKKIFTASVIQEFFFRGIIIGIILCTLGIIMNVAVMFVNDGKMPVVVDFESQATLEFDDQHCLANDNTGLPFLSDWITIDLTKHKINNPVGKKILSFIYLPNGEKFITSPGDVIMRLGIIIGLSSLLMTMLLLFLLI
ncbi:MAG: hypothetical protein UT05_C0002G0013 [Parcubacteria group bacterium GW2011_GWF2_38_76]|nr:MAG: hypothetical protein UT05_C0002G0013 [Parcubacteria group bacterium GW2011_GWF2_38_76]HBM45832.1 hypothetical protein [Patescibacteria group bacterium]